MDRNRGWRIALVLLLIGTVVAGYVTPARAAVSFSVAPGLLDLAGTPGSRGSHELIVGNESDEALTLAITIEPTPGVAESRSAVDWLSTVADAIEIAAGERTAITVHVEIPRGIATGGYYARVSLTSATEEADANAAAIAGRLAVGFLITVNGAGDLLRSARVTQFAPVVEADGRIGFRAELTNDGNVHLIAPTGEVLVRSDDGSAAGSLRFPETTPLLPGMTSEMTAQGSLPLTPGHSYLAEATFQYLNATEPLTISAEFVNEPHLQIEPPSACENLDRGPSLALSLVNPGTLGLMPQVSLAVTSDVSGVLGSAQFASGSILWPGETRQLGIDFPELLVSGT